MTSSQNRYLSVKETLLALRISIIDGIFANIFVNLTGGVFLPAFALALGANKFHIGFLASVPFFATITQLFGSFLVERYNYRKAITINLAMLARCAWLIVILPGVIFAGKNAFLLLVVLLLVVTIQQTLGSISGMAWMSWMRAQVPEDIYGRYFGLRNLVTGGVGILATLCGGFFLDWYQGIFSHQPKTFAFFIIFGVAIIAGIISVIYLLRQADIPNLETRFYSLRDFYLAPLRKKEFRRFLNFAMVWSLVVNVASPFFVVYMLKGLNLSYSWVSIITVTASISGLVGMWVWGHLSDHVGNRPVIIVTSLIISGLPALWLFTDQNNCRWLIPSFDLFGGFLWAGHGLCMTNLLFRMTPQENSSTYFALWSALNGVAAGCGALGGGFITENFDFFFSWWPHFTNGEFKFIFLVSSILRLASVLLLLQVHEEKSLSVTKTIQVLMNVKAWTLMMGFHPILHFFIRQPIPDKAADKTQSPYWPIWKRGD